MKALIISASRYKRRSVTSMMLNPFMSGLREAGCEFDYFSTFDLNIAPCRGDLACWFRTNGRCIQNDDMKNIVELYNAADLIVISTPIYVDGMPGDLKNLVDRLIASGNPFLELRDGQTRHPLPKDYVYKKLVLISSCALWEMEHFEPLLAHLKAICKNLGMIFSGALLRPHAFALRNFPINDILHASKQAGAETVTQGHVSDTLQKTVSREIMPQSDYITMMNKKTSSLLHP
ncbi:MAG TPA: flavodoxin family protein [Chitinispirillaceae bacterium]|nr:flavodoxin family protein [Chitinispirillaceae bacterium]